MKIGYVTASFPFGNGESFLAAEIQALAESDVEVVVLPLFPRGARRPDWQAPPAVRVATAGLLSADVLGSSFSRLGLGPGKVVAASRPLLLGSIRHAAKNLAVIPKGLWMARQAAREGLEHLHVHWAGTTASAGMVASMVSGVPWSMTCHRWDIYEDNLLAAKVASARFTRFISRRGRDDAAALGAQPTRTTVVPLGTSIPADFSHPAWPGRQTFSLLCPANLELVKGHRHLLRACRSLLDGGIDLRLLLAGEGPLRAELEADVARLGLGSHVTFLGQVPHGDLLDWYAAGRVHAVVLPSVDLGGGVHEGVPVSLMEAMARGVPVLSTRTGSIPELLPDSLGLTVEGGDPGALAEALRGLVLDEARYSTAAAACRRRVEEDWSVRRSAARLLDLIRGSS